MNAICRLKTGFTAILLVGVLAGCGSDDAGSDAAGNNPQNPSGKGPAPVALGAAGSLGAAGNYVILAQTGISNVTGSAVTGAMGLRPAAATFITGFSLIADPTNVFSTSSSVVGKVIGGIEAIA